MRHGAGNCQPYAETYLPMLQLSENSICHQESGKGCGEVNDLQTNENVELEYRKMVHRVGYDFGLKRRSFMQLVGAGVLIASAAAGLAQRSGRRGGFGGSGAKTLGARIHLGMDGSITVFVGKVEAGQGARAELT